MLNRLTYASSLSHLRRLNTPLGREGKQVKKARDSGGAGGGGGVIWEAPAPRRAVSRRVAPRPQKQASKQAIVTRSHDTAMRRALRVLLWFVFVLLFNVLCLCFGACVRVCVCACACIFYCS